jgi:hypothetical protein
MNSTALLHEKLSRLRSNLDTAFAPTQNGVERHRYMLALIAIASFFDGISELDNHAIRFAELAVALGDLDHGTIHSLLRAERIANRTPDSTQKWIGRAHVAISVEALILGGQTRENAAKQIAAQYPSIFALATRKAKNLRSAVLGWHREFDRGRVKNDLAKNIFDIGRWHFKAYAARSDRTVVFLADNAKTNLTRAAQIAANITSMVGDVE